jgi:hypothetical protein
MINNPHDASLQVIAACGALTLALYDNALYVLDEQQVYQHDGAPSLVLCVGEQKSDRRPEFHFALAQMRIGQAQNKDAIEYAVLTITESNDAKLVIHAQYTDGSSEAWQIAVEGQKASWVITRLNNNDDDNSVCIEILLPRQSNALEFWHTGQAEQLVNAAIPGVMEDTQDELAVPEETEVLYYSVFPRSTFRMALKDAGALTITRKTLSHPASPGDPGWEVDSQGNIQEDFWLAQWQTKGKEIALTCDWGVEAAARSFVGRKALHPTAPSADFGDFFWQMYLGCLPLNLRQYPNGLLAPRANVLMGPVDCYKETWSRDNTWAFEFLYLVDPVGVADLLGRYLTWRIANTSSFTGGGSDAVAELLLMAGRHFMITGDRQFARQHIAAYHAAAQHLLDLRQDGQGLPIVHGSWDGQGFPLIGKEPYATALCYTGLMRLAEIDMALGDADSAARWRTAAQEIKTTALCDYQEGGLWHTERGTFINYIDYKDPAAWSARCSTWGGEHNPSDIGIPRDEFALYQTVIPIWLGLLDDPAQVRAAYAWIDAHYSYASGRAGVSFPPHIMQNFIVLIDVCVRQQYGVPGADRLLQLILDHAYDGGMPLTERAFGAYFGPGPEVTSGIYHFYPHTHTGRIWDNAPYFGLVLGIHYGLEYTARGWHIGTPRPIANYPLTVLENVRYKDATYTIRWQGKGKIREIKLDGKILAEPLLSLETGEHAVEVVLGG